MDFRARFLPTLGLAALLLGMGGLFGWGARAAADNALAQGVLIAVALVSGGLGLVLIMRALRRPVMVRIDGSGVYMRRLNATFPWDTIASVGRTTVNNTPLIFLEPANPGHPVWTNSSVMMARALSDRVGQPELVVDLAGMAPGPEVFLAAARAHAPDKVSSEA